MHRRNERTLILALAVLTLVAPAIAMAGGDITVALTANRMLAQSGGRETSAPADHAKPGDVIEYRAVYHNTGSSNLRGVAATLPIPAGTEYIVRSASPAPAFASLDGRLFEPLPIRRVEHTADGHSVLRDVPAAEFRALRWTLGSLPSHGEQSVRARVRVTTGPVATVVTR